MLRRLYHLQRAYRRLAWSPQRISSRRCRQLQQLLTHAYTHSSFYREKWDAAGVHPDDVDSIRDLEALPAITKAELREHHHDVPAPDGDAWTLPRHADVSRTSGTTSTPFEIPLPLQAFDDMKAVEYRTYRLYSIPFTGRAALFVDAEEAEIQAGAVANRLFRNYYVSVDMAAEEQAYRLETITPHTVVATPTILRSLTYEAPCISPKAIITRGEVLDRPTKERAENIFDTTVFDIYSAEEVGHIGWQCPYPPRHYHVNADLNVLETASDGAGEGAALVTNLSNHLFPLIRYRLNDTITLSESSPCPFNLPVISAIRGRAEAFIEEDGERYYSRELKETVHRLDGIRRFQIDSAAQGYRLRADIHPSFGDDCLESAASALSARLDAPVEPTAETLNLTRGGKCLPISPPA